MQQLPNIYLHLENNFRPPKHIFENLAPTISDESWFYLTEQPTFNSNTTSIYPFPFLSNFILFPPGSVCLFGIIPNQSVHQNMTTTPTTTILRKVNQKTIIRMVLCCILYDKLLVIVKLRCQCIDTRRVTTRLQFVYFRSLGSFLGSWKTQTLERWTRPTLHYSILIPDLFNLITSRTESR